MKPSGIFCLLVLLATVSASQATIRYVSIQGAGQYTTLEAAAAAAITGDTVLVGPGAYSCSGIDELDKRLIWIGAGWDQTMVTFVAGNWVLNGSGASRSSIEGMRITHTFGYLIIGQNSVDSCAIRRCILIGPSDQIRFGLTGRGLTVDDCIFILTANSGGRHLFKSMGNYPTIVRNCVFMNLQGAIDNSAFGSSGGFSQGLLVVYNSVFLNQRSIFSLGGGPVMAVNNLYYDWSGGAFFGAYAPESVFDYNASSGPAAPGTNTLTIPSDPFVNYDETGNYIIGTTNVHLDPLNGAVFINGGHPSLQDFTDGTRSDFGAYGGAKPLVDNGVPNYPWAVNVASSPNPIGAGTPLNASATVRVGPQY